MDGWIWAILLKPFILLGFLCVVAVPRVLIQKLWPEGRVKRILLKKV